MLPFIMQGSALRAVLVLLWVMQCTELEVHAMPWQGPCAPSVSRKALDRRLAAPLVKLDGEGRGACRSIWPAPAEGAQANIGSRS